MNKFIVIDTPRGQYELLAETVALDRTRYYAKREGFERNSDEWAQEMNYSMDSDYELIDWLLNNSDWEDWNGCAQQINDDILITTKDFWTISDGFEIIER